jgi:hypothetical protein
MSAYDGEVVYPSNYGPFSGVPTPRPGQLVPFPGSSTPTVKHYFLSAVWSVSGEVRWVDTTISLGNAPSGTGTLGNLVVLGSYGG